MVSIVPADGRYNDWLPLQWRHNGHDGISNHQPHHCLLNSLFRCRSKKTSKLHITGLCAGNSPGTGEFPPQMASNPENVSIWWCHHAKFRSCMCQTWVGVTKTLFINFSVSRMLDLVKIHVKIPRITFIIDRCPHSWAAATPVKYKCDI